MSSSNGRTITKRDLVCSVAEKCNCQQNVARDAVQCFLDQVIEELSLGNRIEIRDFGVFETRSRPKHIARNPRTKQPVEVPARASIKFKAGRVMKERIQELVAGGSPVTAGAGAGSSPDVAAAPVAARHAGHGDGD
jgi:nucleoid DNA-binding protein